MEITDIDRIKLHQFKIKQVLAEVGKVVVGRDYLVNRLLIGRDHTLQNSQDLNHWQDIQTFTAVAGTNRWTGTIGDVGPSYYRLKWQP